MAAILELYLPQDFDKRFEKYKAKFTNENKQTNTWVEPFTRKVENGKLPYRKDGLFYSLWKYANAQRLTGKSLVSFMDLAPLEGNPRFSIFEFLNALTELGVELEKITFHEEIYKKYCHAEHFYINELIKNNPNGDFSKSIGKLFNNQASFNDVHILLGNFDEFAKLKASLHGLLEFIEFSPTPSPKNLNPLKDYLDSYIKCFAEDKLFSPKLKNFYKFARQKQIFLDNIEKEIRDYGSEFVFRQGETVSVRKGPSSVSIGKDDEYLFIHILAAMERQDFFEVESILITDMETPHDEQTNDYKIKILASDKLLAEYNSSIATNLTEVIHTDSHSSPNKFWVNKKGQEIWVNDKYYLTKPNYHDDNERFFDYAFEKAKPTIEFTKDQLEAETKRTYSKSFNKLVNGLKFTGQIRKAFFPKVSGKTGVEFRKEVTTTQLQNEGIDIKLMVKELEVSHARSKK